MLFGNERELLLHLVEAEKNCDDPKMKYQAVNIAAKEFWAAGDHRLNEQSFFDLKNQGYISASVSHNGPIMVELKPQGRNYFEMEEGIKRELVSSTSIIFQGDVNVLGGTSIIGGQVSVGDIITQTTSEIRKLIDEKGGEDRSELIEILDEAETISQEIIDTKTMPKKEGFFQKLNSHVVKHGWFYGAVLQLLGTAAITLL